MGGKVIDEKLYFATEQLLLRLSGKQQSDMNVSIISQLEAEQKICTVATEHENLSTPFVLKDAWTVQREYQFHGI